MLTLYDYFPSQNAWKIRVLLGLLGIAYETSIVSIFEGESHTEAFLKLNRRARCPCSDWKTARRSPSRTRS